MKKVVHQIYGIFDDGIPLKDIKQYYIAVQKTKKYCKEKGIQYKMWNLKMCEDFLKKHFKEYLKLWNDFRYPIQRADFVRYCILYKYGGIYIDCDIYPIKKINHLFLKDYFFVERKKNTFPYNAIMGSKPGQEIFKKIIEHCKESTYEKQSQKIYDTWKGRLIFQTTGQYMLKRVLGKDKNILNIICIKEKKKITEIKKIKWKCPDGALFMDFNESFWWYKGIKGVKSKKINKSIRKRKNKRTRKRSRKRQ